MNDKAIRDANSDNGNRTIGIALWCIVTVLLAALVLLATSVSDRRVAINTLLLGGLTAILAVPAGAVTAWAASGRGLFSRALLILCIGLLFVPLFLHVSAWDAAIGKLGWLSSVRGEVVTALLDGWTAAVWVHAVAVVPQIAVIFLLGMSGRRVYEDQALLETGRASVFWHVTMPRLLPLGILAALWTMVGCAREIAVTDLYRIGTLAEQIYLGFSLGAFNPIQGTWSADELADAAATGSVVTIAIVGWFSVSAIRLFAGLTSSEYFSGEQKPREMPGRSVLRSTSAGILLLVLAAVPFWNLFFRAGFFVERVDNRPVASWSLEQIFTSIGRVLTGNIHAFTWSMLIAVTGASVILLIVVPAVWWARTSRAARLVLIGMLAVACAIPGPLTGTWLSQLLSGDNGELMIWLYDRTIFAPVLASVLFCWPVVAMVVWFVFRTVAEDALESARMEGAGWWSRLLRFAVGGNVRALSGCWLIAFALCFGELSASQMVLPPGMDTVPRLTLGWLHSGVDEMTAALTIITVGGIILVSWLGWTLLRLNPANSGRQ